jgi:hypothetical protein
VLRILDRAKPLAKRAAEMNGEQCPRLMMRGNDESRKPGIPKCKKTEHHTRLCYKNDNLPKANQTEQPTASGFFTDDYAPCSPADLASQACQSLSEPLKALRSTLPRMPATWPSDVCCQKCQRRVPYFNEGWHFTLRTQTG